MRAGQAAKQVGAAGFVRARRRRRRGRGWRLRRRDARRNLVRERAAAGAPAALRAAQTRRAPQRVRRGALVVGGLPVGGQRHARVRHPRRRAAARRRAHGGAAGCRSRRGRAHRERRAAIRRRAGHCRGGGTAGPIIARRHRRHDDQQHDDRGARADEQRACGRGADLLAAELQRELRVEPRRRLQRERLVGPAGCGRSKAGLRRRRWRWRAAGLHPCRPGTEAGAASLARADARASRWTSSHTPGCAAHHDPSGSAARTTFVHPCVELFLAVSTETSARAAEKRRYLPQ